LSEIVVLSIAHKDKVSAATPIMMTNDLKRKRVFMSDDPS
jgi:hypothetical protein